MPDAKQYLLQVKLCDAHINSKLEELARLKALRLKVTTTLKDDVVSGGMPQDKLGDATAKIIDLENEINSEIDKYVDHKREVDRVIAMVTDEKQVEVLRKHYTLGETLEQIACEMHMSYRNICYIHGNALQTVSEILKGASNGQE